MRYAVIGTSWIARAFADGAALCDGLTPCAVLSRSRERGERFAAEIGAGAVVCDVDALCAVDCDFVYVASPNVCHYPQCKRLLEAGKNVLCEKPVTVTAEEYRELCDLADANGVIYTEAIMYWHDPDRAVVRDAVQKLGRIGDAHFDFSQFSSKYPALMRGENPNIFNPAMKTGALNDLGIYCVYPALDLFGLPERIIPAQRRLFTGADGSGAALFVYPDKMVTITYSKTGQSRLGSEIIGDEGTLTLESISKLEHVALTATDGTKTDLIGEKPKAELMANEARDMAAYVRGEKRDEYLALRRLTQQVLACMEQMRTADGNLKEE